MALDTGLRSALDRDEFHLVYQPQIDARTGRICAVEALIRWAHPTRGLVSPLDFIPLAEENGLIERIGQWVLRTACADAVRWNVDRPPIDKCFVTGLVEGGESEAVVRAVLAMVGSLGMRVTAEGVETLGQDRSLKAMACDTLQGFHFSRPVAASRIPALLKHRWSLARTQAPEPGRASTLAAAQPSALGL